jgi:hypothetical protein
MHLGCFVELWVHPCKACKVGNLHSVLNVSNKPSCCLFEVKNNKFVLEEYE